jgi:hypothetical protein
MRSTHRFAAAVSLCLAFALSARAAAAPAIGFVETFPDGSHAHWGSQDVITNPGTGGVDGVSDGFLQTSISPASHLGAMNDSTPYAGDWVAANVNRVRFWLNDVGADQNLEIHFGIGNSSNFWLSNVGFAPPNHAWSQFTVDLDSTNFTQIINFLPGFAAALHSADRVLLRHDRAPLVQTPDFIAGEFGIDSFEETNSLVDVGGLPPPGVGRPVALAAPYPNPARGRIACAFDVFDRGPVRVTVVNALGRIVRAETLAGTAAGRRTWMWNGLDDRGATAPAGAYRVRVVGAAGGMSRPFVLLR